MSSLRLGDYQTGYEYRRTKRAAPERITVLLDDYGLSYDQIEKALDAIIHNHGQENIAAAKRVEFVLDDMLTNGYQSMDGYIPPNQDYINAKASIAGYVETAEGGSGYLDGIDEAPVTAERMEQNGQQGAHLLHAVQAVAHVVLLKKGLDIVHVRGGVDILGAPLLAGLCPFAGDEEDGGLPAAQHRLADGLPPVGLDGVVAALGLHIGGDFPADGEGVLLPGVLLCQHHQVGAATGDLPQVPPAVQGLFPRTAEHGDHPAAGVLRLNLSLIHI